MRSNVSGPGEVHEDFDFVRMTVERNASYPGRLRPPTFSAKPILLEKVSALKRVAPGVPLSISRGVRVVCVCV